VGFPFTLPTLQEGPPQKGGLLPSGRYPDHGEEGGLLAHRKAHKKAPLFRLSGSASSSAFRGPKFAFSRERTREKGGGNFPKKGGGKYPKKPERKSRFKRGEAREKPNPRKNPRKNHQGGPEATRRQEGPTTRGPPPEGTKADPIGPPAGAILGGNLRGTQGGKRDPLARI